MVRVTKRQKELSLNFLVGTLALAILATDAMAQNGFQGGGGAITFVDTILKNGWIKNLITAGFGLATLLQVVDRWQQIFEGNSVLKHLAVIGAYVAITIWWPVILGNILSPG